MNLKLLWQNIDDLPHVCLAVVSEKYLRAASEPGAAKIYGWATDAVAEANNSVIFAECDESSGVAALSALPRSKQRALGCAVVARSQQCGRAEE
jgi:hypothetical protein